MKSPSRRKFIKQGILILGSNFLLPPFIDMSEYEGKIITVKGPVNPSDLGFVLIHEHVLVDFIGADKVSPSRYDIKEAFDIILPKLKALKDRGCTTLMECTPAYLGRDPFLLKLLSEASGLHILTNTGYYGAAKEKYLPAHAYSDSANEVAEKWIDEWKNGINKTGIKPGFIKSGVDGFPLSAVQQKMVEAAAITHLATGLTICIHTGSGAAAKEEMRIITSKNVSPEAWVWVHAQSEKSRDIHIEIAKAGGWISYDGVHSSSIEACIQFLKDMKRENLLNKVLLSHDSGWFHVGEPGGGKYNDYNTIIDVLIPAMKKAGFTEADINLIFKTNPQKAFAIRVRKIG